LARPHLNWIRLKFCFDPSPHTDLLRPAGEDAVQVTLTNDLQNFEKSITQFIARGLNRPNKLDSPLSLESGVVFPRAMMGEPVKLVVPPPLQGGEVADGVGHRRWVYRTLLLYAWLGTLRLADAPWPENLSLWCDSLAGPTRADPGEEALRALVLGVAGQLYGRSDWRSKAEMTFARVIDNQLADGALLPMDDTVHPEMQWYSQRILLHAMASWAVESGDPKIFAAAARAAAFEMAEVQPDHATQQPWGVFAFLIDPNTAIAAEEILHQAVMGNAGTEAISLILLADALWCIRHA
jgi:hypothetical protein